MKNLKLLILLTGLAYAAQAFADTTWVASGNVSGVWSASGSPYVVHAGDVTVATGETLLIEPGVRVYFAGSFKMVINGLLQAIGTESDSIWFTGSAVDFPFDSPVRWRGLRFVNAHDECQLSYCSISYSGAMGAGALSFGGGVYCSNTTLGISHSRIHHCHAGSAASAGSGCGAYFIDSEVLVEYTDISENSGTLFEGGVAYNTPAGGFATSNTTIHLRHCTVRRNRPGINIGGIRFGQTTVATVDTCLIDNNWTPDGGYKGIVADPMTVISMTGTTISNHTFPGFGFTGGMRCEGMSLTMDACTLRNNSAGWINPNPDVFDGGAGLMIKNPVSAVISRTVFESNDGQFGAAVLCNNTRFEDCSFLQNIGTNGSVCSNGGNVFSGCEFVDNEASLGLGALSYQGDGVGGGIFFNSGTDTVANCLFKGNSSRIYDGEWSAFEISFRGGALFCDYGASPYIVNSVFTDNNLNQYDSYGTGSVLCNQGGNVTFEFCTMDDNPASGGVFDLGLWGVANEPGGVIYSDGGTVTLKNCVMSNSLATTGIWFSNAAGSVQHSDFFGISGGTFLGSTPVNLGVISTTNVNGDPCDHYFNIYLDPSYVDAVNGDLHLSATSLCVDAADPVSTVASDFDGNARPSGAYADMGAFEYQRLAVTDLAIYADVENSDAILYWSAVAGASGYEIYAGNTQEYDPGNSVLIGTTTGTTFTDADVLLDVAEQRSYVVIVVP